MVIGGRVVSVLPTHPPTGPPTHPPIPAAASSLHPFGRLEQILRRHIWEEGQVRSDALTCPSHTSFAPNLRGGKPSSSPLLLPPPR